MAMWEKVRGKAVAVTAVGTAAAIAGLATYKYYKVTHADRSPSKYCNSTSKSTQTSTSSLNKHKRKLQSGEETKQSATIKRSRPEPLPVPSRIVSPLIEKAQPTLEFDQSQTEAQSRTPSPYTLASSSTKSRRQSDASTIHSSVSSDDNDENEEEEEDPATRFHGVCESVSFAKLEEAALRVQKQKETCKKPGFRQDNGLDSDELTCSVENSPRCGSYNIVFPVAFSDGVQWLVRIPGHGHQFGGLDKLKLDTEYQTMRYIKENTSIPLPVVHYWQLEADEAGSAFALMEFLPGRPLCEVWKDSLSETQRLRVLKDIAKLMSQLQFAYHEQIGMLRFKGDGLIDGVGAEIALNEAFSNTLPWDNGSKSTGPYLNLQSGLLDNWDDFFESQELTDANSSILKMASNSIPQGLVPEGQNPVNMADLDSQNILVDDSGCVTGIIDWDGCGPCPASVGCARYPNWLLDDWRPWYDYNTRRWDEDQHEPSPEEMIRYRRFYADAFARYSSNVPEYNPQMTRLSHILWAVQVGITSSFGRVEMISKILKHAFGANPPFNLGEYFQVYADNDISKLEQYDQLLKEAFANMWHAEWELPELDYDADID